MQRYAHRSARTRPSEKLPEAPRDFVIKIARPLHATSLTKPSLTLDELQRFNASVSELNFETGASVNPSSHALLKLHSVDYVRDFVCRVKPWAGLYVDSSSDDFLPDSPDRRDSKAMHRHRLAAKFSDMVSIWVGETCSPEPNDSLLLETAWCPHSDRAATKWLGAPVTDDYVWRHGRVYHNLNPMPNGFAGCRPDMPHAIYHAVDSTPFDGSAVRMSEFKSILFLAIVNNMKPEYKHLDYFGVTVLSFCDCDVRIVQGLVNLKTHNIDLRVSSVQQFPNGVLIDEESIDERFLTLLAYNCAKVIPQTKQHTV